MASFEILCCVPEAVTGYLSSSILGRAARSGRLDVKVTDLHTYGEGKHRQIDDSPYGGGSGMLLKPEPVVRAIEDARTRAPKGSSVRVILFCPSGKTLTQERALSLANDGEHLILLCGRYEGLDARVEEYVDELISLGDFVLTGGELAAMALIDAVTRLQEGVLGNDASSLEESFCGGLLEYPQFTRPPSFRGAKVPEVLLSGNHSHIKAWRAKESKERTKKRRPDLLENQEKSQLNPVISRERLDESSSDE